MHHCHSLSMLSLFTLLLLGVSVSAFWPYAGGQPLDATTNVNAPSAGAAPSAGHSTSFHDLTFVNNGCVYHNGMITENGGPSRKATAEEEAKVKEYMSASQRTQQQFQQSMAEHMRRIFAPPFPFGQSAAAWQFPQIPHLEQFSRMGNTPCFCESCRNASAQVQSMSSVMGENSGDSANSYNQYSMVEGGQQQQQQQ